jgi:hypothetical protein
MDTNPVKAPKTRQRRRARPAERPYLVVLAAVTLPECASWLTQPVTGITVGVLFREDGTMGCHGVVVPDFAWKTVAVKVEFTSIDESDDDPSASITALYVAADATTHKLYTAPLSARGEVVQFQIPSEHLAKGSILSIAIGTTLTSFNEDGSKRPVLIRGAWLEFAE